MMTKDKRQKKYFAEFFSPFLLILFLSMGFSQPSFAWPWSDKKEPKNSNEQAKNEQAKTGNSSKETVIVTPAPSQDAESKNSEDKQDQKETLASEQAAATKNTDKTKENRKNLALKPIPRVPVAPLTNDQIAQVQNEIQHIIQLNEKLKLQHQDQAAEIQRISEQAQIHQRILNSLQSVPRPVAAAPVPNTDAAELVKQEKIRLIQQETARNRELFENLNRVKKAQAPNQ